MCNSAIVSSIFFRRSTGHRNAIYLLPSTLAQAGRAQFPYVFQLAVNHWFDGDMARMICRQGWNLSQFCRLQGRPCTSSSWWWIKSALYIKSSLKPFGLKIEAFPCIELIYCRISTYLLFTEAPTLLSQTIYLSSNQFDVLPLPKANVLSLVALMPPLLTGQIAHVPNQIVSMKTYLSVYHPAHTDGEPGSQISPIRLLSFRFGLEGHEPTRPRAK